MLKARELLSIVFVYSVCYDVLPGPNGHRALTLAGLVVRAGFEWKMYGSASPIAVYVLPWAAIEARISLYEPTRGDICRGYFDDVAFNISICKADYAQTFSNPAELKDDPMG